MKKILILFLTGIVLVILQTSFFSVLFGSFANPNLVFAFCFAFLILGDRDTALQGGMILGLALDILLAALPGITSVYLIVAITLAEVFERNILRGTRSYYLILALSCYVYQIIGAGKIHFELSIFLGILFTLICSSVFARAIRNYTGFRRKSII